MEEGKKDYFTKRQLLKIASGMNRKGLVAIIGYADIIASMPEYKKDYQPEPAKVIQFKKKESEV